MKINISENKILFVFLAAIGICLCISAMSRGFIWDEAHHANPALFLYNLVKDSPQDVLAYATDYHAHYKFFSVLASYPPMNTILVSGAYTMLGPGIFVSRLVAIAESLIMLFFVYKLSKFYSRGSKYMPFVCVLLAALHPVIFLFSSSNMLDIGMTLFIVAGSYFFIKFLRTERRTYLFGLGIAMALGILCKLPMVLFFVPLILVMVLERKLHLFHSRSEDFLRALIIFLVFVSPFLAQLWFLHSNGISGVFMAHWDRPSESGILQSFLITEPELVQSSLGVVFYQWFLAPFLLIGIVLLLRKRRDIDKLFLITAAFFFWFYTSNIISNIPDPRFVMPVVPFLVIISCHALVSIGEWVGTRRLKLFVLGVFVVLASAQSAAYYSSIDYYDIPNLDRAAIFVIENAKEPTSVLTTWGQPQMFEFARLDSERKIYTMYLPKELENVAKAVRGDFSYYRSMEWWERFGIEHPVPDYLILHEKIFREKVSYEYNLSHFEENPEFELLGIIESDYEPNNRIFIYKIEH